MSKTLLQRIATAISTAPQGETYEDCRNNEAKAVLEEISKWMKVVYFKNPNHDIDDILDLLKREANK